MWTQFIHALKVAGAALAAGFVVLLLVNFLGATPETLNHEQSVPEQNTPPTQPLIEPIDNETEAITPAAFFDPPPTPEALAEPIVPAPSAATVIPPEPPRYNTPPIPLGIVTERVLPSLVNILCNGSAGVFNGISGSGIVIDQRGVILTNAHVAQYILLQDVLREGTVNCTIRTGAPAKERYKAELLFLPQRWAEKHATDLLKEMPTGTGEHDWALLRITERTDGSPLPATFAFMPTDTREHIARKDDSVLLSSYPAGFLASITIRKNLWPVSTVANIEDVFTFETGLVDILSLGGTIVAQSGSSGGAVVNEWGQLVGIIVTSSLGDTTAERDLRAMTLSHIERSMFAHLQTNVAGFLNESLDVRAQNFKENLQPYLLEHYSSVLQ